MYLNLPIFSTSSVSAKDIGDIRTNFIQKQKALSLNKGNSIVLSRVVKATIGKT